jgi:hypothetical protein
VDSPKTHLRSISFGCIKNQALMQAANLAKILICTRNTQKHSKNDVQENQIEHTLYLVLADSLTFSSG